MGPKWFAEHFNRLFTGQRSPHKATEALDALGTDRLGLSLAQCEQEQSRGPVSSGALDELLASYTESYGKWYRVQSYSEHREYREAMDMLFRDAAKMLATHGRLH